MTSKSHVVIWVEDASDILSQVAIKYGLYVVPVIDWKWGEKREMLEVEPPQRLKH